MRVTIRLLLVAVAAALSVLSSVLVTQQYTGFSIVSWSTTTSCPRRTGWRRIVELYAAHWDVVNVIAIGDTTSGDLLSSVQRTVLCAAPLALNEFGTPSPAADCVDGWFSVADGCARGRYGRDVQPAWQQRLARRDSEPYDAARRTRLFSVASVPDVSRVAWVANQHDSEVLRPADVSLYVLADDVEARGSDLARFEQHLAVQASETLHAVIVVGPVCHAHSPLRLLLHGLLLEDAWLPSTIYCGESDFNNSTGMIIMTLKNSLVADGPLVRFQSMFGAPLAVSGSELFVRQKEAYGHVSSFLYSVPPRCVYRLASTPLQRIFISASNVSSGPLLASEAYGGFSPKYLNRIPSRSVGVQVRGSGCVWVGSMRCALTHRCCR
jgi:hypothetical protein